MNNYTKSKSEEILQKYYINIHYPHEHKMLIVKSKISAIEEMKDGTAYIYVSADLGYKSTIPYKSVMSQLGIIL